MKGNERNPEALNLPMLIVTAIVSALAWTALSAFYLAVRGNVTLPVLIGVVFAVVFAAVCVVVFLLSSAMGTFRADVVTGKGTHGRVVLYLLAGTIVYLAVAAGLQLIYQTDFLPRGTTTRADYVFIIDDSGSMSENDPNGERYRVISELLAEQPNDTRYAIYSFADETQLVHPMQTVGEGVPDTLTGQSYGLTYIKDALEQVMNDYDSGVWQPAHDPVVILLTDGLASDVNTLSEMDPMLQRYDNAGITVSTIGMGSVDRDLLSRIADSTGGQFVDISDASQLGGAFRLAAGMNSSRDLLTVRGGGWAYGLLRVLFVTALGVLLMLMVAVCYGNSGAFGMIVRIGAVKALIAAVLLELGLEVLGLPELPVTLLTAVLLGTVVACYGYDGSDFGREVGTRDKHRKSKKLGTAPAANDMDDFW